MDLTEILYEFESSHLDIESKIIESIKKLIKLDVPHPAQGNTYKRWQILAQVAATNLNLVKWFESHLDVLSILEELQSKVTTNGLTAIWAAEGSAIPLLLNQNLCSGEKNWCSGAGIVEQALMTYRDTEDKSQLILVDMSQSGIHYDLEAWHSEGMRFTRTARLSLDSVVATKIAGPNAYLTRAGFWHGAAGVAACWFGATCRIADFLIEASRHKANDYSFMYLGDITTEIEVTKRYFQYVAEQIDLAPKLSHEYIVRILRAKTEATALRVLEMVGKALGARPFCENKIFAQLTTDLPVFLRQSHAAFDLKQIALLKLQQALDQEETWHL